VRALREARFVRLRVVPIACVIALLAAFTVDLFSPQLLVAAILLDVPIVMSSLGGNRRFTYILVVAALVANAVAGYVNGAQEHHWSSIAIGDRALAGLSIIFVGYLSTTVQQTAQRAGRLAARQARTEREARLAASIERVRASLSIDLVLRAIAREATVLFDIREARFVLSDESGLTLAARAGTDTVDVDETRPAPEVASLVARTLDGGDIVAVAPSDALGRLVLDRLNAPGVLALPIVDRERRFGVVLLLAKSDRSFEEAHGLARAYATQSANALAQARLFAELAERNTALEERGAVIRDLVYALSHDLRTPLAALGMTMRQARSGAYGALPPAYNEILDRSVSATDDVSRLAETLLLVARFESDDRRPERERVDLCAIAHQIAGELDSLATAHGVGLHVAGDDALMTIGDRTDLRRAITNLVANGLQHTPQGGNVTITLTRDRERAIVEVSDDGYGVSEEARSALFTRFAPGEGRRGGGTGLGLYIVRRVAQETGGNVAYVPRQPRGSTFVLNLPRTNA
jgi:signal transduction histidine kinase